MKKLFTILIAFMIINLAGFNIILKNGDTLDGKLLLNQKNRYYVLKNNELLIIHKDVVKKIAPDSSETGVLFSRSKQKINLKSFPVVKTYNSKFINGRLLPEDEKKQYVRPNLKFLPIGIGFAVLGYDNFRTANDISKEIKSLEDSNVDIPKVLRENRNHRFTYGCIFLGVSIINIYISLEKVELYNDETINDDIIVGMQVNF